MEQLEQFAWDNNTESIDFFGEVEHNPNKKEEKKTEGEDKLKELEKTEEKKEEVSEEEKDAFKEFETSEVNEEDEEQEEDDKQTKKEVKDLNTIGVVSFLKDKKFLDFELEEGEELDEDKASELLESKFEESVEAKVGELIKDLPDTIKNLIKFASNGGDVNQYISSLQSQSSNKITKDLDLEEEKNQELVVRQKFLDQGEDEEDVDDLIEHLKTKNKLKDTAEKYFDKVIKDIEEQEAELVEKQKTLKKQAKENQVKFKKEISTILSEKEEISNLKFNDTDKKELPDYISNASIPLQDGRVITPFYNDLFETLKDKEKTLLLAKLIKSGFDFTDIEKAAKTKQTKELKENLQRTKDTSVSKGSSQPKRLTDYFN